MHLQPSPLLVEIEKQSPASLISITKYLLENLEAVTKGRQLLILLLRPRIAPKPLYNTPRIK
jgi:hypothetical protein